MVTFEFATLVKVLSYVPDGTHKEHCRPESQDILDAKEDCQWELDLLLTDSCITGKHLLVIVEQDASEQEFIYEKEDSDSPEGAEFI